MVNVIADHFRSFSSILCLSDLKTALFNKSRCYPSNIGGHNKNSDIAVAFSESFSDVYFDSYSDSSSFVKCLDKVHSAIRDEDCILDIFNVADIEKGVNARENNA